MSSDAQNFLNTNIKKFVTLKLCLVGDWGTGKTSIRRKFMGSRFKRNYLPTVGADFSFKEIEIDGMNYKLLTWDLAGESKFKSVRGVYFQGAYGILLVFDLTNHKSFESLDSWLADIEESTQTKGLPIWLIGNKNDLIKTKDMQKITDSEIEEFLEFLKSRYNNYFDIGFSKTSALTGNNIDEAFEGLVRNIMKWLPKRKLI